MDPLIERLVYGILISVLLTGTLYLVAKLFERQAKAHLNGFRIGGTYPLQLAPQVFSFTIESIDLPAHMVRGTLNVGFPKESLKSAEFQLEPDRTVDFDFLWSGGVESGGLGPLKLDDYWKAMPVRIKVLIVEKEVS